MKYSDLIKAYANGAIIECHYKGWSDWMLLKDMRSTALRTFMGIDNDSAWSFRIKK